MNDQISRQKLIEALEEVERRFPYKVAGKPDTYSEFNMAWESCMDCVFSAVESQPPADQWIPCSEREPEDPCVYTVEDCSLYTVNKFGSPQRYVWKVLPPMFGTNYRLVAWKPVDPEPYKGE